MALVFSIGIALTLGTYGVASYYVGKLMLHSSRRGGKRVALLAVYMLLLWLPCVYAGLFLTTMIPLEWGHAREAYLLPYLVLTPIIFIGVLMRFSGDLKASPVVGANTGGNK